MGAAWCREVVACQLASGDGLQPSRGLENGQLPISQDPQLASAALMTFPAGALSSWAPMPH
jgi:hypothetical protein